MSKVSAAIRFGTPVDDIPSFNTFLFEMEMFKRLGLRREDILKLSAREVKDYGFFISMIQREEQAQQAKSNHRGAAPSARG